jgi:hypothetical protein
MPWTWAKVEDKRLASFVTPEAVNWLRLSVDRLDLVRQPGGRRRLVEAIYETLVVKGIRYVDEEYDPHRAVQPIRTPEEILSGAFEGTCLDLTVLFAGLCLGYGLLPMLVVFEGHSLVAVSLKHSRSQWDAFDRPERSWFERDVLKNNLSELVKLIDQGALIAVECTGFARSDSLRGASVPEGGVRTPEGVLTFNRAVEAGREQFSQPGRPFSFALDVAVAQYHWRVEPERAGGADDPGASADYQEYTRRFIGELDENFPKQEEEFDLTFDTLDRSGVSVDFLFQETIEEKRLILRGYAGGGKSTLLRKCALVALERNIIAVIINLKNWKIDYSRRLGKLFEEESSVDEKFDLLLNVSITDLSSDTLNNFPRSLWKFVMVDGLNEVYGEETTRQILSTLHEFVRAKGLRTYVLVADRLSGRGAQEMDWGVAELNPLELEKVQALVDSKFGAGEFGRLSETEQELLRIPYFMNHALTSGSPKIGSATKACETFFIEQLRLSDDQLNMLATASFNAYKNYRSPSFPAEDLRRQLQVPDAQDPDEVWRKLTEGGTIKLLGDQAQFDHQLKHDYLASRHLSQNETDWNSSSFDAVSFESKTFEPLTMALEQLSGVDKGDRFLKSVYDWNWAATIACLAKAVGLERKLSSREMQTAILAVVAEKLFDPIRPTKERAQSQLKQFPPAVSGEYLKAERFEDIVAVVDAFDSGEQWFSDWKDLFTRMPGLPVDEETVQKVADKNSIIGWTAANMIRRSKLTDLDFLQLRTIYRSFAAAGTGDSGRGESVQWRVVHALGASVERDNVELLFRVLGGGGYHWAQYGAARSLVEIAATADEGLRREIIERLTSSVGSLSRKVLEEIVKSVLYERAPATWCDLVAPLLEKIISVQKAESDRERFSAGFERFKEFCERSLADES